MDLNQVFRLSLLLAVVASGSGHAASPPPPGGATLERDGYRMTPLAAAPQRRDWEREAQPLLSSCSALPALPGLKPGTLSVEPLVKDRYFNKFFQGGGRLERLVVQQKGVPQAIVLASGTWRLSQLQSALAAHPEALQRSGTHYLLRMPLLIREGAGLVVDGSESLRLSRDRGAFVINLGTVHVQNARLEGWSEATGTAALVNPDDGQAFQPFLLGWSGSTTVIRESQVTGLGFGENLAHGLEFAIGPIGLAGVELPPPPRVYLVGSSLEGMYSAVRGTGIPDIRICQNHFDGSRQSAIHLESGSSGVIAENRITGTQGPYAVYFNKAPRNVWIIRNDISENRRSGLSLTDSDHIVVAGNTIRQNYDALFLQSSDEVLLADNRILDNQRHGVTMKDMGRVRLQGDAIGPNRGVGVMALRGAGRRQASAGGATASPAVRKSRIPRLELLGVALEGNHSSSMVVEAPYTVLLDRADVIYPDVRRRPVFRGVLNAFETDILYLMPRQKTLQLSPMAQATASD